MLNVVDLNVFPDFNRVYFKQALDFYSKHDYIIYQIVEKNENGEFNYYTQDALLFVSSAHKFHEELEESFELNNLGFHKIPILKNKETVYENPYFNALSSITFTDEILSPNGNLRYADFILINDNYEDYHIFNDFKQLITEVKIDTSMYDFENNDTEKGIIFPFFIEKDSIKTYDIDKLTKYIFDKNNDQSISIISLKEQYKQLIEVVRTITSDHRLWIEFFDGYDSNAV